MWADFTQASQPAFTIPSCSHNDRSGAARTASGPTGLAAQTGVDELMITTMVHGHADRMRSYELVAEAWDLAGATRVP